MHQATNSVTGHVTTPDLIDALVPLAAGSALHAVRHQRDKVVAATQGSLDAVFDPALPGLSLAERLLVAQNVAQLSGGAALSGAYSKRYQACRASQPQPNLNARLDAMLKFARTLALHPVEGDRAALLSLPAAGLSTPEVITLAQLIALVAFQVRVIAGLQALVALVALEAGGAASAAREGAAVLPAQASASFIHPAQLPLPTEALRINGYTSETLGWKAWLPVQDIAQATPQQLAVLKASHPKASTSDYYLTLIHQPRMLEERSIVFNAIMYAPGGLSRAERELASTVVSRVNGCVYCASVHAQRFEQLSKRNDVIAQVFAEPQGAGTNPRERAIVQAAIDLTRDPAGFSAAQLHAAQAAGLTALEMLDMIHAIAIFAWANRLMLNLGEAVAEAPHRVL